MARGGARNRCGPKPDEQSERSERRNYSLTALPAEGYDGPVPKFPLPQRTVRRWEHDGKRRAHVRDGAATTRVRRRELALWEWLWRTPQACAWSLPSEAWRLHTIALYVRTFVICEGPDATAADKGSLHRFADQIGMTTAGLAEMGWRVSAGEMSPTPTEAPAAEPDAEDELGERRERRLRG